MAVPSNGRAMKRARNSAFSAPRRQQVQMKRGLVTQLARVIGTSDRERKLTVKKTTECRMRRRNMDQYQKPTLEPVEIATAPWENDY